jgi:hypothetical protein
MYDLSGRQIGRVDGERCYDSSVRQIGRVVPQGAFQSDCLLSANEAMRRLALLLNRIENREANV